MNLIDKKELLNERPEMLNPNMNDGIKSAYNKGWNACNSEWISLIDEQPTAYDIDEVVKQLKENYLYSIGNLKMISRDEAIEIVKKGGAE